MRWFLLDWQADVRGSAAYARPIDCGARPPPNGPRLRTEVGDGRGPSSTPEPPSSACGRRAVSRSIPSSRAAWTRSTPARTRFAVEDESGRVYEPRDPPAGGRGVRAAAGGRACGRRPGRPGERAAAATSSPACISSPAPRRCVSADAPQPAQGRSPRRPVGPRQRRLRLPPRRLADRRPAAGRGTVLDPLFAGNRRALRGVRRAALELYQDSSGGENWRSHNHLNRKRDVPDHLPRLPACGTAATSDRPARDADRRR